MRGPLLNILWKSTKPSHYFTPHSRLPIRHKSNYVDVNMDNEKGIGELRLNRAPVNALSLEFTEQIINGIDELEKDSHCKGIVISSGQRLFSGGLDLAEFHCPDEKRFRHFWSSLQELASRLFGSKLATVAAINGSVIAGGLIIAASCDYRIMLRSNKAVCGFNEVKFGLVAPLWVIQLFQHRIGTHAELNLLTGKLLGPEEARDLGLINELLDNPDHVLPRSQEVLAEMSVQPEAFAMTKMLSRQHLLDDWRCRRESDLEWITKLVFTDRVQKAVDTYVKSLKK